MTKIDYDTQVTTLDGKPSTLREYQGKVLLIVNTASECGFTPQYAGLQKLYEDYRDRGLVVLGFPCNQFGGQEPGDAGEIATFCRTNYGVDFPMHAKIEVNGDGAHPLFTQLKEAAPGLLGSHAIKWNFTKFLVGRDGTVHGRRAPQVDPGDLRGAIESLLDGRGDG